VERTDGSGGVGSNGHLQKHTHIQTLLIHRLTTSNIYIYIYLHFPHTLFTVSNGVAHQNVWAVQGYMPELVSYLLNDFFHLSFFFFDEHATYIIFYLKKKKLYIYLKTHIDSRGW
jgi:hypothetical protein